MLQLGGSYKANTSGDRHLVTLTIMSATSTSANTVAGPSPNDIFRPPSAMISGDLADDVVSNVTQLPFSSGNPRIEETRGVMHLYRDDISLSSSDLPVSGDSISLFFFQPEQVVCVQHQFLCARLFLGKIFPPDALSVSGPIIHM